ncbi:protein kinase domain-containing protein [Hyalangium minutum]|uniref:Serine/threonine protein kinase PrkC, regulator of stationary phase n=1 Tax=Hyalangium minutum TaxID=394096 RepID=A0A085WXM5_9BACT|nr:protein kinase [Hyalangium minutum]KFE72438.1 Serine/threonine protein kinase PrkC, regulator of stationary phase [Hyalangium minutum]
MATEEKSIPFGKYELLERLGVGGMANVYRARYTAVPGITKPVVIKRVLDEYAENPTFMELFIHEARISVGLSHGNIVQVFDFGQVNAEYYLAMELVDGQPLSRVIKRAQQQGLRFLPQALAASIALEMCKGLHYAHTRKDEQGRPLGIVHRDVSPDNVLVSYDGEVKITDFGIAKAQLAGRPITAAGMVKGKYLYLSPEQAQGQDDVDARSDVYAVGVVLYRMLCGRLPFEGQDFEVMARIVQGGITPAIQLNPDLDGQLNQIVMRALATSREDRFQSAEALQQALSLWMASRAPLFSVNSLKHLMGWLYTQELAAQGRAPVLPQEFLDQVRLWKGPSGEETTPDQLPAVTREAPPGPNALPARPASDSWKWDTQPEALPTQVFRAAGAGEASSDATEEVAPAQIEPSTSRRSPLWSLGVAALAAVMAGGLFWVLRGPGTLEIHSEPPGAQVRIDGQFRGVTPLVLEDVKPDAPHTMELVLLGKKSWERSFAAGTLRGKVEAELEELESATQEPAIPDPESEPEEAKAPPQEQPEDSRVAVATKKATAQPKSSASPPSGLRITAADKPSAETAAAKYKAGVKQLSRGKLQKAKELFWQCLAHDPKSAKCFRRLGEVSAALGNTEEALEYYARFLELDPRGDGATAARDYVREHGRGGR